MPSGDWRPRPDDGGTAAGPGPDASSTQGEPDMAEAFETTRSVVEPLLAVNDSRYQEEQFDLALNQETGDAILYLPHTGTIDPEETGPIDVDQLAADLRTMWTELTVAHRCPCAGS